MDQVDHQKIEQERFDFLKLIYDLSDGNSSRVVSWRDRGENLRFSGEKITELIKYLYQEGLVKIESENNVSITDSGANEIGRKLTNPENPTEHFGEGVITNIK